MSGIPDTPERQAALQSVLNASQSSGGGTNFTQKLLRTTFSLGALNQSVTRKPVTSFASSGNTSNTVTKDGLRTSALITYAGAFPASLQLRVWGMSFSDMNDLSSLGLTQQPVGHNSVLVEAGTSASGFGTVFQGTVMSAWADFEGMPDVVFHVHAMMGGAEAVKSVPPLSYQGGTDVATIMADIATSAGLRFENNGVSGIMLASPYFPGSPLEQARAAAAAANIHHAIDSGTLAIWPRGGSRGSQVPLVSAQTGMKGYPTYTGSGLTVQTIYNPSIAYGGRIQVQSDLPQANGEWIVYGLTHNLEALLPGGQWVSRVECWPPGFGAPPVAR